MTHSDEFKAVAPWFKCFPRDWRDGTSNLTPEQRGIYFDCLCYLYEFERPIPEDDKWVACHFHISPRLWRSIRDALVSAGKLIKIDGGWTNARAKSEIDSRSNQSRVKRESALNRERTKRENLKNNNDNNDAEPQKHHYVRARQIPDTRIQIEDISQPGDTGSSSARAPAGGPSEIQGLNGSTALIVEQFANWLSPYVPDLDAAHRTIAEACQIYGPDAVRDGFADLKADHRDGKVRALSVKAFYGFVRTAKERRAKSGASKPDRTNMRFVPSRYGAGKWVPREVAT